MLQGFFISSLGGLRQVLGKRVRRTEKGALLGEAWDAENLGGSWSFRLCLALWAVSKRKMSREWFLPAPAPHLPSLDVEMDEEKQREVTRLLGPRADTRSLSEWPRSVGRKQGELPLWRSGNKSD